MFPFKTTQDQFQQKNEPIGKIKCKTSARQNDQGHAKKKKNPRNQTRALNRKDERKCEETTKLHKIDQANEQ